MYKCTQKLLSRLHNTDDVVIPEIERKIHMDFYSPKSADSMETEFVLYEVVTEEIGKRVSCLHYTREKGGEDIA